MSGGSRETWRTLRARFDWGLAGATVTILTLGFMNLWSAVREREPGLLTRQLQWLVVSLVLFVGAAAFDYRRLMRAGYAVYAGAVAVLVLVLVMGRSAWGAQRWLQIGPIVVQPSEIIKLVLVIALAKHIQESPSVKQRTLRHLVVPVGLAGAPFLLIALQPDLDTALVILLVFLTVMVTARLSLKTWGGIMLAGALAVIPMWKWGLHDYQKNRIVAFANPAADPATAWQPQQAKNAIGSGRLYGKGYLQGTQFRARPLPALWTDFPYAVWGEEWGFLGGAMVLGTYAWLILWILRVGRAAKDPFGAVLCIGCSAMLFWQIMFNLGMVLGMMPVAGITLPLLSYGGSSLMTFMVALGLVMNVSLRRFRY